MINLKIIKLQRKQNQNRGKIEKKKSTKCRSQTEIWQHVDPKQKLAQKSITPTLKTHHGQR